MLLICRFLMRICTCTVAGALIVVFLGCWTSDKNSIVVYTALDREFSEEIFEKFTESTGIRVLPAYDAESNKTVGLTNRIIAEANRPRCNVFWNNEILNTLRLERQGLLDVYVSARASEYPLPFRSASGTWHGFAARARVLLVNRELVPIDEFPSSIHDLIDPKWKNRAGIAKPLFGTTATHAACLFAVWGEQRAQDFFTKVHNNTRIKSGNKQIALTVASGELAFGLTDTDDAIIEVEKGHPVTIVYPDQRADELGTLFIPNTVSIIRGKKTNQTRRLIDFLLSPDVEMGLAHGPSAQIPLNVTVDIDLRVKGPKVVTTMKVDFDAAADHWDSAREFLHDLFVR